MSDRLYDLLPLFYREKDADRGEPLRALMSILQLQYDALHTDIEGLYDDWFIETCEPRIIPYIADLLSVGGISHVYPNLPGDRRRVANTIAYRRRKGTAAVLASALGDATGWPAYTLEYFRVLAATQDMAHLRPGAAGSVDLRELVGGPGVFGPFATAAHAIDVRQGPPRVGSVRPEPLSAGGAYGIDAVGVFLWRLQSYPVEHQQLRDVSEGSDGPLGRFTFHPMGVRTRLFNAPDSRPEVDEQAGPQDLPVPLTRALLAKARVTRDRPHEISWRWSGKPVLTVRVTWAVDHPPRMAVGDLSQWALPHHLSDDVDAVVDPETGRLAFPKHRPGAVHADFAYGMVADIGGGPYDRIEARTRPDRDTEVWIVGGDDEPGSGNVPQVVGSIAEAHRRWLGSDKDGLIRIAGSDVQSFASAQSISIPAGRRLAFEADIGVCPTLVGSLTFDGAGPGATVAINGCRIDGTVILKGSVAASFADCTVGPPLCHGKTGGIIIDSGGETSPLRLELVRCITGPIEICGESASVSLSDCIVDGGGGQAIGSHAERGGPLSVGPVARIVRSTVLGPVSLREVVEASDSLFTGEVTLQRRFSGYFRYCYLPLAENTAMRYRCQPDPALLKSDDWDGRRLGEILAAPRFTSIRYGDPGYGQLAFDCSETIRRGASNGGEIGAFALTDAPRREAAIDGCLKEYLPYGMRVKVFYVT